MNVDEVLENIHQLNIQSYELIQPPVILSPQSFNYILANIEFNYILILFTMGCFTSLLICHKKPISRKKFIIVPSYEPPKTLETDPILSKV
tara:strand:+ start:538 stop:810 length:273 start_codon:yes stop_codon:yes gene_type:complete